LMSYIYLGLSGTRQHVRRFRNICIASSL
jgi:hypothetical protein